MPETTPIDTTTTDLSTAQIAGEAGVVTGVTTEDISSASETPVTPQSGASDETPLPVVPETYTLQYPDGIPEDATVTEKTAAMARTLGLSNDHAQALLTLTATTAAETAEAALASYKPGGAEYTKLETGWRDAVLADPEIGGTPEKLAESVALSQKVLGTFGSPELQTFLHANALGSHPAVLRFLTKIGKSTSEGTFISSTQPTGTGRKSDAEVFFPTSLPTPSE